MVRNYKKKRQQSYDEQQLREAIFELKNSNISLLSLSKKYKIPRQTLQYWKNNDLPPNDLPIKKGRFVPVFNNQMAEELKQHIVQLQKMFYGLTSVEIRRLAYQFANLNGLAHPFNNEKKLAGRDWLDSFMKIYNLSYRKPEATSMARVAGFSKPKVEKFFRILKNVIEKHQFKACNIYNVDETGVSIVQTPRNIIAQKGLKQVGRITSAERGKNITVVGTISAGGTFIPPMIIFPRVRHNPQLGQGSLPGTLVKVSPSGWMDTGLFLLFLQHFIQYASPSEESPVLLIVDGHGSHKSLEAINLCREKNITVITFPPHTSNRLQPLDVTVYAPFKTYISQGMDNYMTTNPGERITEYVMGPIIKQAYVRAFTPNNILKGFEKTGIYPYNDNIFDDDAFIGTQAVCSFYNSQKEDSVASTSTIDDSTPSLPVPESSANKSSALPSGNGELQKTCIRDISPLPKPKDKSKEGKRTRTQQEAQEITSSPFKEELENKRKTPKKPVQRKLVKGTKKISKKIPRPSSSSTLQKGDTAASTSSIHGPVTLLSLSETDTSKSSTSLSGNSEAQRHPIQRKLVKGKKGTAVTIPQPEEQEETFCIYCHGKYGESQEEWIGCCICKLWAHEECSDYEGVGVFTCDLCRD